MSNINPLKAKREELIDALRGHVSPRRFHDIVYLPTATLRGLYVALTAPVEERKAPFRPKCTIASMFGFPVVVDEGVELAMLVNDRGESVIIGI